jgi:outer membrane protein assembly factor BamA
MAGLVLPGFLVAGRLGHESDSLDLNSAIRQLQHDGFFNAINPEYRQKKPSEGAVIFIKEKDSTRIFSPKQFIDFQDSWLLGMLKTGYPFANYVISPDTAFGKVVQVTVNRQQGLLCLYDSISNNGLKLSPYFLRKIGGLAPGLPFNEDDVQRFRSKMLAVNGYSLNGEAVPSFYFGRFVLNHAVVRQKRDRLSGLLGLATEQGKTPVITGEADAAFYDLFGHGLSFYSRWRRFQERSQELFAGTELPYLLGTPFIAGLHLGLEKYDTVYTRLKRSLELRFPISRHWRWSFGYERTGITGLGIDTFFVKARRSLPFNAPSRSSGYMVSIEKISVASVVFPRRGLSIRTEATLGSRIWLREANVASVSWRNGEGALENMYDSLQRIGKLRQTTFRIRYSGAVYFPVLKNWVGTISLLGEEYRAPNMNFSELSRWGGINSIRGFNEQRIFANSFHMVNFEFRYMAGTSGYVAPFVSAAGYRNATDASNKMQFIHSMGLSGALKTGAGVLRFAWALGNDGNGFVFRDAKFHLGLSNAF